MAVAHYVTRLVMYPSYLFLTTLPLRNGVSFPFGIVGGRLTPNPTVDSRIVADS